MRLRLASSVLERCVLFLLTAILVLRAAPLAQAAITTPIANIDPAITTTTQSDPSLVGYWPFDLGSADADLSGNGNTVTAGNGLGLTSNAAPTPFANQTALLSSLNPTSYATAPGNQINDLQQFTISFWLRMSSLPSNFTPMTIVNITNKARIEYDSLIHNYFSFSVQGTGSERTIYFRDIQPNVYYHIAATYDANGMSIYVNGQLKNSIPGFVTLVPGAGVAFSSPTTPLDGMLDDVRIYNRSLSQGEVASLSYQCSTVSEIPQAECQALKDLYTSAGGAHWTNQTNWLLNNAPCSWYGVLCANGHVLALSLSNNGLSGPLPATLGNLSSLIVLSLYTNQLSGDIPRQLGDLPSLQTLDLFNNQLSGLIPYQIGALSHLQTLRLYNNQLRGAIPTQLANLTSLLTLDLSYNALSTSDSALMQFLNAQQPSWAATQTVPPTSIQAKAQSGTSVAFTWTPIPYSADGGYYEVLSIDPNSGMATSRGKTVDKAATGLTINGLTAGQNYSFLVRTFTPKHGSQSNDLISDPSEPITIIPADQPPATITIALDVQPNSATNFRFDGGLGTFYLDDITPSDRDAYSSSKTFSVAAGTYTVHQVVPGGWFLTGIACNPSTTMSPDLTTNQLTLTVASGANITCTFITQRAGQVIGGAYNDHNHNHKQDRNDEWLNGWAMQLHTDSSALVVNQVTNQDGRAPFTNLRPGNYTICEMLQSGWFNITPGSNPPCYTVNVAPGTAVWTRFGNSTTPLVSMAAATSFTDIVVCDLRPTDDLGDPTAEERDPWEEQEDASQLTVFLPIVQR